MNNLLEMIKSGEKIVILPHDNIDGDAFCSAHALKMLIKSLGKEAVVLAESESARQLEFLGLSCKVYESGEKYDFDTAVAIDCADKERLGQRGAVFDAALKKAVIDHHKTNKGYGDINLIYPDAAAACQVVYNLFDEWKGEFSPDAATLLYCGIVTDTGGFRYSNTTPETLLAAAHLLKCGADAEKIMTHIFETKPRAQFSVEAEAFRQTAFYHDGKTAICKISQKMQESFGASDDDLSNISSQLRCIEGVLVSATIKEKDDCQRISLRSKDLVDVAEICAHFGGGGHMRAAGATSSLSAEETENELVRLIGESYERLH